MGKEALKTKEEMQAIARKNAAARIKKVGVSVCAVSCDTPFLLARERERERDTTLSSLCVHQHIRIYHLWSRKSVSEMFLESSSLLEHRPSLCVLSSRKFIRRASFWPVSPPPSPLIHAPPPPPPPPQEKADFERERARLKEEIARDKAERKARGGKLSTKLGVDGYKPAAAQGVYGGPSAGGGGGDAAAPAAASAPEAQKVS